MNLTNLTFDATMTQSLYDEFNRTCVLNQYALIETTNKLPKLALWLSIAIFIVLALYYIILPFLSKWKHYEVARESLPGIAFAMSIWLPLILMYFTLDLNESGFKTLENWLLGGVIILVAGTLYFYRRRIKEWILELKQSQ